jgi:hypothetical protein
VYLLVRREVVVCAARLRADYEEPADAARAAENARALLGRFRMCRNALFVLYFGCLAIDMATLVRIFGFPV